MRCVTPVVVEAIVPVPANVNAVADVAMVSMLAHSGERSARGDVEAAARSEGEGAGSVADGSSRRAGRVDECGAEDGGGIAQTDDSQSVGSHRQILVGRGRDVRRRAGKREAGRAYSFICERLVCSKIHQGDRPGWKRRGRARRQRQRKCARSRERIRERDRLAARNRERAGRIRHRQSADLGGVQRVGYRGEAHERCHLAVGVEVDAEADVVGIEIDGSRECRRIAEVRLKDAVGHRDALGFAPDGIVVRAARTGSRRTRRRVQTEEERIAGGQHIGTVRVHDLAMEIDLLVDAGRGIRLLR